MEATCYLSSTISAENDDRGATRQQLSRLQGHDMSHFTAGDCFAGVYDSYPDPFLDSWPLPWHPDIDSTPLLVVNYDASEDSLPFLPGLSPNLAEFGGIQRPVEYIASQNWHNVDDGGDPQSVMILANEAAWTPEVRDQRPSPFSGFSNDPIDYQTSFGSQDAISPDLLLDSDGSESTQDNTSFRSTPTALSQSSADSSPAWDLTSSTEQTSKSLNPWYIRLPCPLCPEILKSRAQFR